jgi:hypothetical protein
MGPLGHAGVHASDFFVAGTSLLGLLVVIRRLDTPDALSRTFRGTLALVAAFTAARAGYWWTGSTLLRGLNLAAAALIPLCLLILAEVLLRRHAPLWGKGAIAAGSLGLALTALLLREGTIARFDGVLAIYQLSALAGISAFVLRRDRGSLRSDENALIDRVCIALPLVVLFLASDFDLGLPGEPLRLSGVAVLVTCWIGLGLRRSGARPLATLGSVAFILALGVAAAILIALQLRVGTAEGIRVWAVVVATLILAALLSEEAAMRGAERQRAFVPTPGALASAANYLGDLRAKDLLDGVLLVEGQDLADFDAEALRALLGTRSVVALAELPAPGSDMTLAESQLRIVLERFEAAQAHLLRQEPLQLALVRAAGPLGADPEPALQMAFSLVRALEARPAPAAPCSQGHAHDP